MAMLLETDKNKKIITRKKEKEKKKQKHTLVGVSVGTGVMICLMKLLQIWLTTSGAICIKLPNIFTNRVKATGGSDATFVRNVCCPAFTFTPTKKYQKKIRILTIKIKIKIKIVKSKLKKKTKTKTKHILLYVHTYQLS